MDEEKRRNQVVLTSEGVVGHAEEGDAGIGGAEDVEDVAILCEAEARLCIRRQLLEDAAGHGTGVARHGGELSQHHSAARHQRVHDRHGLNWSGKVRSDLALGWVEAWGN
jgi:hypothetical protein